MTTIIVNSKEHPIWNWEEKQKSDTQIPGAGIHPKVQQRLDSEASERNPMPQNWDVSFGCDMPLNVGNIFFAKDNGQKFVVIHSSDRKYFANRSL